MKCGDLSDKLIASLDQQAKDYAETHGYESSLKLAYESGALRGWISLLMAEMTNEQLDRVEKMIARSEVGGIAA